MAYGDVIYAGSRSRGGKFVKASYAKPGYRKRYGRTQVGAARKIQGAARGYLRRSGYYGRAAGPTGELKFHDIAVTDAVIAANGTIQNSGSVNLIAQDTTESGRLGRKCVIKNIGWRYRIKLPLATAASNSSDTVRVILYQDK